MVLDATRISSFAARGAEVLVQASDRARAVGGEFYLVIPSRQHPVRRVLEALELVDRLPVQPDIDHALAPD